jgi:RNA recognition motif-containing protein
MPIEQEIHLINTTLKIRNFTNSTDASDLEDMFSMVGNVRSARVIEGIGYVEMSSFEEMQNGVHHFHGQPRDGQILMVQENKPHVPKPAPFKIKKKSS